MEKFFNTAGAIKPDIHYYLPDRLDNAELYNLINHQKYFILHAPRQTGKTTAVINFAKELNEQNDFKALYVNVEPAQAVRGNVEKGMIATLSSFKRAIQVSLKNEEKTLDYLNKKIESSKSPFTSLNDFLSFWSQQSTKPIVLFIDEIDSLVGDTLISVLRQLRAGYSNRPAAFPQAVCLVGVRDVRDYRIWSDEKQAMILGGSAFNIKAKSLRLADFSEEEVRNLYLQHTEETGQKFDADAIEYAFHITQGQPWLANALAYEACFEDVKDRNKTISKEIIEQAKETLIIRRDTHLDVLEYRLQEPRVRKIVDSIIKGKDEPKGFPIDDIQYIMDLGLIKREGKDLAIANPIYKEVIPRQLTYGTQMSLTHQTIWYQNPDETLNMKKLLGAFQQFFREHSDIWCEKFDYKESGPHLLLMAFLQRILNGGGKLHREYALGRRRVDLLVEWMEQRIVIELKVRHSEKTIDQGLEQTAQYMDTNNSTEGHLIIFDRRKEVCWDDKIYVEDKKYDNKLIRVWGM